MNTEFGFGIGVFVGAGPSSQQKSSPRVDYPGRFLFVMIVYILLLNLLIAMMGDTYAKIAAIKNEWMRQWARIVLIVERTVSPKV